MAFRMGRMTILRATEPKKVNAAMRRAIAKHRGNATHIAHDLEVGLATFKRWVVEDAGLTRLIAQTRKAAKAA